MPQTIQVTTKTLGGAILGLITAWSIPTLIVRRGMRMEHLMPSGQLRSKHHQLFRAKNGQLVSFSKEIFH